MAGLVDPTGVSYSGLLTLEECTEGISLARANACRLIKDARLLFAEERYPSAAQLAILAIEESGKEPLLRSLAAVETEEQAEVHWRGYRTHIKKNVRWAALGLADRGHSFREMLASTNDPELARLIERYKQRCTYTDCGMCPECRGN